MSVPDEYHESTEESTTEESSDPVRKDLDFINRNFAFGFDGLSGNSRSANISVIARTLGNLLQPYIAASVRYRAATVRLLNFLFESRNSADTRLIDDIEVRLHEQNDSVNLRIMESHQTLESRIKILEERSERFEADLLQIDAVTRGLEALVRGSSHVSSDNVSSDNVEERLSEIQQTDNSYILLENRYRGSEEVISGRMEPYVERIKELLTETGSGEGVVVEIGCGRGELLSLLRTEGISAIGIEPDQAMVRRCRDKGLEVHEQDAVEYFRSLPDHSVNGVVAIQVIEHLGNDYRSIFLDLIMRKVVHGGFLVLETINTSSFLPLLQNYFRDPTHVFPLHPDTLRTILEQSGLVISDIIFSSEYPEEAKLQLLPPAEGMPFRYQELSRQINERLQVLNRLVFGSQDYAVIARIP